MTRPLMMSPTYIYRPWSEDQKRAASEKARAKFSSDAESLIYHIPVTAEHKEEFKKFAYQLKNKLNHLLGATLFDILQTLPAAEQHMTLEEKNQIIGFEVERRLAGIRQRIETRESIKQEVSQQVRAAKAVLFQKVTDSKIARMEAKRKERAALWEVRKDAIKEATRKQAQEINMQDVEKVILLQERKTELMQTAESTASLVRDLKIELSRMAAIEKESVRLQKLINKKKTKFAETKSTAPILAAKPTPKTPETLDYKNPSAVSYAAGATDAERIAAFIKERGVTKCPPAVLNPSEHIDTDRLMGAIHKARAEDLPTRRGTQAAFWKEAKASAKARAIRGITAQNMKSNRKGAVI